MLGQGRWLAGFRHHLLVALIVASVVGVLHGSGALGWLDAVMLSFAGSAQSESPTRSAEFARRETMPLIWTIGQALYESEFHQTSPLDRRKLARLIGAIPTDRAGAPTMLVLDLDVSPVPGDAAKSAQQELDQVLHKLATAGTRLLIPLPGRTETRELQQLKLQWLQRVCSWKNSDGTPTVTLALPYIKEHFGRVIQFQHEQLALGNVAANPTLAEHLCPSVASLFDALVLPQSEGPLGPFNARFFTHLPQHRVVAETLAPAIDFAGRTVFLGGAYDDKDRFLTPLAGTDRRIEGVAVHAAIWFSTKYPVDVWQGLRAFLLDILLGLLIGYLFGWTWSRYQAAQAGQGDWSPARNYLTVRGLLLGNFAVLALLIFVFMSLAAGYFYPRNYWINPGPIILGVFVKFLISSRGHRDHPGDGGHADPAHAHAVDPRPPWGRWLDQGLAAAVIVAGIWAATHH